MKSTLFPEPSHEYPVSIPGLPDRWREFVLTSRQKGNAPSHESTEQEQ